jgi:hypothetical protein
MGQRKKTKAPEDGSHEDPRFVAAMQQLGRTGMAGFNIGFANDEADGPIVWWAQALYDGRAYGAKGQESAAGPTPLIAIMRLLELVMDGSTCTHCGRMAAVESEWRVDLPLRDVVCWYQYDPETQEFHRGCA